MILLHFSPIAYSFWRFGIQRAASAARILAQGSMACFRSLHGGPARRTCTRACTEDRQASAAWACSGVIDMPCVMAKEVILRIGHATTSSRPGRSVIGPTAVSGSGNERVSYFCVRGTAATVDSALYSHLRAMMCVRCVRCVRCASMCPYFLSI